MSVRFKAHDIFKTVIVLAVIAAAAFAVIIGFKLESREAQFKATKSAFTTVLTIDWMAFNDGYFSWGDLQDNVELGNLAEAKEQLLDIVYLYPFVVGTTLENKAPPQGSPIIESNNGRMFLLFSIKDDYGRRPLPDWTAVVEIDSQELLDTIRPENRLHVDGEHGKELAYSLKVDFADPLLGWTDHLIVLLATMAIGIPVCLAISRKSRFFYETKGLESIIFLFEQAERESANHSRRVAALAIFVGQKMGYRGKRLRGLYTAALLHDIGKIAIPSQILQKSEPLTRAERQAIQTHPVVSARILRNFKELSSLSPVVLYHHERMDGSGYPDGLKGDEISVESRIIAVVDVFEALIGKRPYRDPVSPAEAFATLKAMPLDQTIVDILITNYHEFAAFKAPKWVVAYVPMPD